MRQIRRLRLHARGRYGKLVPMNIKGTFFCAAALFATGLSADTCVWGRAPNGEFWNGFSKRFIYAPAFGFKTVPGAVKYVYEVTDDWHVVRTFESATPDAGLEALWPKLPVGYVTVVCRGTDAAGATKGEAGRRTFWKKAAFTGNYPPAARSYAAARNKVFDYFLGLPQTRYLMEQGKPDLSYPLNGYPSKMLAAEINALLAYAKALGTAGDNAGPSRACLETAKKAADYLIADAVPAGQPLEHFTRTYAKEGSEYGRFKGEQDTLMLVYPATAGSAFVNLYNATKDATYLTAAQRIAATYAKLQGEDGTWFLKQNAATGKETAPNRLVPIDVIEFLEALHAAAPDPRWRAMADRAFACIERGPLTDWNWEGQFEDIRPERKRWGNLSKHPACSTAMYLLRRFPGDAKRLAQAEALFKLSEDQFVEWIPPYDGRRTPRDANPVDDGSWNHFCHPYSDWVTPCALEQYNCYCPIDASAVKIANTALALWRATGKGEYLAKAKALGDSATRMQESDGFICTWWMKGVARNDYRYHTWINCLLATARMLDNLAAAEHEAAR